MIERNDIYQRNQARIAARGKLIGNAKETVQKMRPGYLVKLWLRRQTQKIVGGTEAVVDSAKRRKGLIGLAALGTVVFVARKPLKRLYGRFAKRGK